MTTPDSRRAARAPEFLRAHTRILASFHSFPENGFGGGERGSFVPGFFRVVGVDTSKGFGDPAGSFTLTLKPEPGAELASLLDLWREPEGVWVYVWVQLNGRTFDLMLCNIDSVNEDIERDGTGARSATFTITGRDFGKVFAETELFINIFERSGAIPMIPLYNALAEEIQFTPGQITNTLVREWVGNNELADTQWQLPPSLYGGRPFYQALNRTTIDLTTRGNAQEMTLLQPDQQGQKLWDSLMQYCNPVLNELWCDLAPDPSFIGRVGSLFDSPVDPVTGGDIPLPSVKNLRPALYLRERPFVSSEFGTAKWERLPTHRLRPNQIVGSSFTSGSSQERFNFWEMKGASAQTQSLNYIAFSREQQDGADRIGDPGSVPIFNRTSIRRYGLRRFQQSTRYFPINDARVGALASGMIPRWLRLLHDWYGVAPSEITGSLRTSYIMPWIRIGHRVDVERVNGAPMVFYVEGVHHSYSYPNNGSTTLHLTRGEKHGSHLLRDLYKQIRAAPGTLDDIEGAVPGMELTEDQARVFREENDALLTGIFGPVSQNDPATATDELGAPTGGDRLLESTASERQAGDSQTADPSMNFSGTAIREDPAAEGVEGIDARDNTPPDPTESADPEANIISLDLEEAGGAFAPAQIVIDEEFLIHSSGSSIPDPSEGT